MTLSESSLRNNKIKGLTLIETVIYLAILAIFMGSVFALINQSFENAERARIKMEVTANLEFLAKKIEWAVNEAQNINSPAPNNSANQLSVNKFSTGLNPIVFTLNSGKITLSKAGGPAIDLTNNKVRVEEFLVEHFSSVANQSTLKIRITIRSESSERFRPAPLTTQMFFSIK